MTPLRLLQVAFERPRDLVHHRVLFSLLSLLVEVLDVLWVLSDRIETPATVFPLHSLLVDSFLVDLRICYVDVEQSLRRVPRHEYGRGVCRL